jgi:hypothetical protein
MDPIIRLNHQRFFGSVAMDSTKVKGSSAAIYIWDFKDFTLTSEKSLPACTLGTLSSSIEVIIGAYFDRLIFLDASYWVCSIDISMALEVPVRHFFIPNDWVSLANQLIMDVGKSGEIFFVKQSELAVIKRGLEVTENGAVFNPRRRSTAQILELPTRPGPSILQGQHIRTIP